MTSLILFAILGLGAGAAYALLAQGLVLIHRGSGVVNFAHGSMAMVGAFLFFELHQMHGVPVLAAGVISVVTVAALGAAVYLVIMRRLLHGSALSRIIAALGLLISIQGICTLIWGELPKNINALLPSSLVQSGDSSVGLDRFYLLGIAVGVSLAVWAMVRFTRTGIALRANAENRVAAATLGWSSNVMGTLTWSLGAGLAALAGILIAPLTGIAVDQMPLLVIPALAAALVGRFKSFPITLVAAFSIGVLQSVATRYIDVAGISEALPFLIILVVLVITKQAHAGRQHVVEVLPRLGSGRVRRTTILITMAMAAAFIFILPSELVYSITVSVAWATVMLSVVVLLGLAGQLSLAQFALAGIAALIAGRTVNDLGAPFLVALLVGVVATIPVGLLFALPALRTKGASLAVVTLGLAVTTSAMVFNNAVWTGGPDGTPVGYPEIFGLEIDGTTHPERYALVVIAFFTLCALVVTNIRRGGAGRSLIAVRTNERAAAALGVNVFGAKLYAFALAAALAALGGILLAFRSPFILYADFVPLNSILVVAFTVVGGVGYIMGAFNGGTLVAGGLGAWVMHAIVPGASPVWLSIIGGVMVTALVVLNPNGLTDDQIHLINKMKARFGSKKACPASEAVETLSPAPIKVIPETLAVEGLTVRFGGVTALQGAALTIRPGEVLGLIGPNGAGKTTFIDAVTGFVPLAGGSIKKDADDVSAWPVHRRSRAGISRSFQSLELFESSTVRENLRVAADPQNWASFLTDLVNPRQRALPSAAIAAINLLGLQTDLDTVVSDLSYGRRRLVAIARSVASAPSILLLDEPAAGLSMEETTALGEVVRVLAKDWGIAILVVEHDMSFVMNVCDQVTVLDFGRQIGSGTPEEIRVNPAVIAAYLGAAPDSPIDEPAEDTSATIDRTEKASITNSMGG